MTTHFQHRWRELRGKDLKRHVDKMLFIGNLVNFPKQREPIWCENANGYELAGVWGRYLLLDRFDEEADKPMGARWRALRLDDHQIYLIAEESIRKVMAAKVRLNWINRFMRGKRAKMKVREQ